MSGAPQRLMLGSRLRAVDTHTLPRELMRIQKKLSFLTIGA